MRNSRRYIYIFHVLDLRTLPAMSIHICTHVRIIRQNKSASKGIKKLLSMYYPYLLKKLADRNKAAYVLGHRCELVEATARGEDDERDLGVAEHRQLERLLEEAAPPLREGHLPTVSIYNSHQ